MSTFNQIDVVVVLIDIVFLCIPEDESGGDSSSAQYTKTLRLVRMVRLLRILRAAKVINALSELGQADKITFVEPTRYSKAPSYELETMNEMVDILLYTQSVMQDRDLSIFLRKFYCWENGEDKREPQAIFQEVVAESDMLTLAVPGFDDIFLDVIMFRHTSLVQGALDLIMLRHSSMKTLLYNARQTQLLVSPKRERQFRLIDGMLQQLERNAGKRGTARYVCTYTHTYTHTYIHTHTYIYSHIQILTHTYTHAHT